MADRLSPSPAFRAYGPAPLAAISLGALAPHLKKRGMAQTTLVTQWAEIVGPLLAPYTHPLHLRWPRAGEGGATLTLVCPAPFALEAQMATRTILESCNRALGFGAAAKLKIVQGPLPERKVPSTPPPRDPQAIKAQEARFTHLQDPALRHAVAALAAAICK